MPRTMIVNQSVEIDHGIFSASVRVGLGDIDVQLSRFKSGWSMVWAGNFSISGIRSRRVEAILTAFDSFDCPHLFTQQVLHAIDHFLDEREGNIFLRYGLSIGMVTIIVQGGAKNGKDLRLRRAFAYLNVGGALDRLNGEFGRRGEPLPRKMKVAALKLLRNGKSVTFYSSSMLMKGDCLVCEI